LFTGDAEVETERALVASRLVLRSNLIKIAHHGSRHSTSSRFLQRVQPKLAVISCSSDNEYGHPHPALLRRLKENSVQVLRTDQKGDVTVRTDGTHLVVE
jgi:competence protein ComEC